MSYFCQELLKIQEEDYFTQSAFFFLTSLLLAEKLTTLHEKGLFHWTEITVVVEANSWKHEEWGEIQSRDVDPVIVREWSSAVTEGGPPVVKTHH